MSIPRSTPSAPRLKARRWFAWAALTKRGRLGLVADDTPLAVFLTREDADNRCLHKWTETGRIVRVVITEVRPAPPRRKAGRRKR